MLKNLWWQQGPLMAKDEDSGGSDAGGSDKDNEEANDEEGSEESEEGSEDSEDSEESEDEENEDGVDKSLGLNKAQIKEAANLYKLLADQSTQKSTLEILARKAGLLGDPPKDKRESREAAESLVEILEKSLGKELGWLAPKLANALEKIREQDRGETRKELDSLKQGQIEKEVDSAYETLARETKGNSRKFEGKMVVLADKLLPAPGMSTVEYIRHLYTIASAGTADVSNKKRLAEKINRNSKDVPGRLGNSSSAGGGKGTDPGARLSVKQAVRQAAEKMGYKGD